jgi:DNA-binding response OmpR family regulator
MNPRAKTTEAVMSEPVQEVAQGEAVHHAAPAQPTAFIIDDDAGICRAMSFTLRKLGFASVEIATPAALEAALGQHAPELVFLDLGLGQAGAGDILPILARHGYAGPVQLMSGRSQGVIDEVAAVGSGMGLRMLPVLVKPFRMGVIKELVAGLGFAAPDGATGGPRGTH